MASKRMSISALLSGDPSRATPPVIDDPEPPHKRPRHTQSPQRYESYNAYSSNTHPVDSAPISGSPSPSWSPHPSLTHTEPPSSRDDAPRYSSTASEFARAGLQPVSAPHDDRDEMREPVRHPAATGTGESLVSVLTGQMRARQMASALPAPPQLRREHQLYTPPVVVDDAPVHSRDISPIVVKSTTPHTTSPHLSPSSAYTPTLSPPVPFAYSQPNPSSMTVSRHDMPLPSRPYIPYTPHTDHPPPSYSPYAPPRSSPSTQYAPISSSNVHVQPMLHVPSRASPSVSPSTPYILPLAPPSSRVIDPISPTALPPPPPPAPAPPPQILQLQHVAKARPMNADEDRLFEDELLSLVDGHNLKPETSQPSAVPLPQLSSPKPLPQNRKGSTSITKPKVKAPPKAKSSKTKQLVRQASGPSTPVPVSSMPPPTPPPPPQQAKQQPPVSRAKGKSTGSSRKKAAPRSRSLSVKPPDPTPAPAGDMAVATQAPDDRLYCLCRKPYDEDKVMIACDRCDEWYHPACVGMPEVEVDLVDQFICASCATQNPALHTTYKQRCHRGLNHIGSHDSLPACWKPARGAFSKYCSDECGMAHMRAKIARSGRDPADIWPAVKHARRREGVTISHANVNVKTEDDNTGVVDKGVDQKNVEGHAAARKAWQESDEREVVELRRRLEDVMRAREERKLTLEHVVTRRRLLDLAVERAQARFCGWDARLEMSDAELASWVGTEEGRRALEGPEHEDEAQWWCQGPEKCPRHTGWQSVRDHDVQLEVDSMNLTIKQLTDRERELRRRIEDLEPPSLASLKPYGRKKKQSKKFNSR